MQIRTKVDVGPDGVRGLFAKEAVPPGGHVASIPSTMIINIGPESGSFLVSLICMHQPCVIARDLQRYILLQISDLLLTTRNLMHPCALGSNVSPDIRASDATRDLRSPQPVPSLHRNAAPTRNHLQPVHDANLSNEDSAVRDMGG